MIYKPNPIDTSDIELPDEMEILMEKIAKNVHEVWAVGRIMDGWRYGSERSSSKKTTPCLVPYEDLSEEEKEFDRNTASETLKIIIKMGYTILPPREGDRNEGDV